MKEASENQESNGFMSDYFSPGSKVGHFNPPHPGPGFPPETPMKPSQIPNRYPPLPPIPRRPLPFHSPPCHYQPPQHQQTPPQPPRNHCHLYQQCNSSGGNGENNHHSRSLRSQNPHGSPYHKDATGQVTHQRYEQDRPERAPDERTDHTGQDANKGNTVESRLVPMPLTRLSSPLMSGSGRETAPLTRSNSWGPSSKLEQASVRDQGRRATFPPNNSSTVTQTQPNQLTLSNQTSRTEDTPHVPLKRRRESSSEDENAKKQCLRPTDPEGNLQFPDANALSSLSFSQKGLEPSSKTTENHAQTESVHLHALKSCLKRTARGAKQACIKSMHDNLVVLLSPKKTDEKTCETKHVPAPKRVSFNLPNLPGDPKSPSRVHQADDNKTTDSVSQKPAVKQHKYPCRKLQRNKKPVVADDITELFTPDPTTYIVNQGHKTLKVMPECKPKAVTNKSSLSPSVSSNPQTPDPKLSLKDETAATASQTSNVIVNVPEHIKISLPRIILTQIQLPTKNTRNVDELESVEKDVLSPGSSPPVSPSRSDGQSEEEDQEDYLDLDLDLNFDLDLEVRSTRSSDSEDVQLVSLREIMTKKEKTEKEKSTPERSPSETSSPGHRQHSNQHHTATSTKIGNYKNSLDQLLKEFNESKRAKEIEAELLSSCQEDLLKIAEYEETESREEHISPEQQQFLQRFSLTSSIIRDVPPGHEVFNLEKFGRIFNQDTLQLRQCNVTPQSTAQKAILWSSHSQFKLYITSGLFQEAFCSSCSPCPFQITLILFKMMSVRSDRLLSDMILQVLVDIAKTTAVQRVNSGDEKFRVWVPSLADITLVLMNMGAPFVLLFPLETLQPPFTEGELLEDVYIISESPSKQVPRSFPEHNCTNIYKYLSFCLGLCPRFYSDSELLLLLTLLCTVSLETRLLLHTKVELYSVLYDLLKNIRHWDDMMPKICQALTALTDDHHNMCHLIQQLPHHSRGRKLRQHLSLSMISKLLNGSSLYTPKSNELQLCELRPYLPRMKPSCLLQIIASSSQRSHTDGEDDQTLLDQQAYYLCYSLLTLVNEATNFYCFPAHQKEQLLLLCSELERHIKCHIREGENWLYRSKVKDLVARIYTKWQMMLQKTRPLNGKLYDYWQPLQSDAGGSLDIEEIDSSQGITEKEDHDDKEEPVTEMEVTQSEKEEKERAVEDSSPSNAAEELDTEDVEEGCVEEERANSTFKPDSEGGTNTAQDSLCEDMETDEKVAQ